MRLLAILSNIGFFDCDAASFDYRETSWDIKSNNDCNGINAVCDFLDLHSLGNSKSCSLNRSLAAQ